ncbi:DUF2934 domain-containing protein [Pseudomonas sp. Bout1]|uniref:DUF2934 domain-containing protein n=1 Tax=Pseudomonas sp. Bout1 TaxID=3048600 RepID=UPI002AB392A3|nr:DUF2934 domain-containing protein [Pseudomonas sp. Bout1]MDY7536450.1 DUF2934 domain-containing protein [Pseudomonas sp. Bout1]MEB0187487.1 DUF2934 domain-containing protein [Pseudomonas sp. Bout1]
MMDERKIKEAAYALWEQDGKPNGQDLEHWFKASSSLGNDSQEDGQGSSLGEETQDVALSDHLANDENGKPEATAKKSQSKKE